MPLPQHQKLYTPVQGKTYSLFAGGDGSEVYYAEIRRLADLFLTRTSNANRLLSLIQKAGKGSLLGGWRISGADRQTLKYVREALRQSLSGYTREVLGHLRSLPLARRTDTTLTTTEEQYHLYMLEIEMVNRIYRDRFKAAEFKFALLAHCLRDFRPGCRSVPGDMEAVCQGCTEDCLIHLGSVLLNRYGITPYISVEMDQEKLFAQTQAKAPQYRGLGRRLCTGAGHGHAAVPWHRHLSRGDPPGRQPLRPVDVPGPRNLI